MTLGSGDGITIIRHNPSLSPLHGQNAPSAYMATISV